MKNIIYKTLLICLLIIGVFTIKCYGVSDFSYTLDASGNATITAYNGTESNLTIPSTIDDHKVIAIGAHAFDESRNSTNGHTIKNIVISEGIIRIDGWAFCKCENLESVKMPESLTYMDWQIFLGCEKLVQINIPHKLTNLNNGILEQTGIKEITIPENIQKFVGSEFRLCKSLKKAFIYNDNIDYYNNGFDTEVFKGCDSIVLYGNEGSTTQTYAQQNGIKFELLSSGGETTIMASIKLNKDKLELKEMESETLAVTILEMPTDTKLIWSSSDENVASVDDKGKVIAKSTGNTIITVSTEDGEYKDICAVSVIKKDDVSISLNKTSLSLYVGDSEILVATILPDGETNKNLVWSSSNEKVATVENGKVIAKSAGTAEISVSNADGTRKATCKVTVYVKENNPDNTVAGSELPEAGKNTIMLISIVTIIIVLIVIYKKQSEYKDIK